jgi:proteasome accessory factor B
LARNVEITRQWNILTDLEASHYGMTRQDLAARYGVNDRTIRRDLEALTEIGFPIEEAQPSPEGRKRFRLNRRPLQYLSDTGITLREACALYFSQSAVDHLENTTFARNARSAFTKLRKNLPEPIRRFLDQVPQAIQVKAASRPVTRSEKQRQFADDLLDAIVERRVAGMRYYSMSHRREKDYLVEPYQVVYGHGALYLCAFVPEYGEVRVFHLDRIRTLTITARKYTPQPGLISTSIFSNSLGAFLGDPSHVELEFVADIAPYVTEREWHPSQRLQTLDDGRVQMALEVCIDAALRTWILGWGGLVRVLAPDTLVEQIRNELSRARAMYALPAIGAERAMSAGLTFARDAAGADAGPTWPPLSAEDRQRQLLLPLLGPIASGRRARARRRG